MTKDKEKKIKTIQTGITKKQFDDIKEKLREFNHLIIGETLFDSELYELISNIIQHFPEKL